MTVVPEILMELYFLYKMEGYTIHEEFSSLIEAISMGLGNKFRLIHSTSILRLHLNHSAIDLFQH